MAQHRTPEEIELGIAQARQRLADNLASLVTQVHPRVVTRRTVVGLKAEADDLLADSKRQLRAKLGWLKGCYLGAEGPRTQAIAIGSTVVAIAVVVALAAKK
ncbi:MAG: DUF3618 domain-containing protein [Propionibacteriaceae bacterium]|nr:DUF3618 domain-containing protein [Propionibacteriaceae bacterium]